MTIEHRRQLNGWDVSKHQRSSANALDEDAQYAEIFKRRSLGGEIFVLFNDFPF